MNKTELIKAVTEKTEVSKKDVTAVVECLLECITEALASGEPVKLAGFGNFEARKTNARVGRNPQTGEEIDIPAGKKPAFKAAKALKEIVNN